MPENVIVIGSGPAGLTAGIYLGRAKLNPMIIEGMQPGGQLTTTTIVKNWPGNKKINGVELMMNMKEHAIASGCNMISGLVVEVDFSNKPYKIFTKNGNNLEAQSIIIAVGSSHRKLKIEGEEEYWGKGVAVCTTCDAPLFQDKNVVIVGGGNGAVTKAQHLSSFAKKVIIISSSSLLTATDPIKDDVINNPKVEIIYNFSVEKIIGDGKKVTGIEIKNLKTQETKSLDTDGIFLAIGMKPNTDIFKNQLELNQLGCIVLKKNRETSKEGIFAAGDVADYTYRQAITAAGFGCMAALDCQKYLKITNY